MGCAGRFPSPAAWSEAGRSGAPRRAGAPPDGENAFYVADRLLRSLAREAALDLARFETDYAGEAYEAVLHDCAEGAAWFGVSGLPTVILNEKLSLVGAVPTERYRLLIDWILAGEPGGVIPLTADSTRAAAGQSPVDARPPGA